MTWLLAVFPFALWTGALLWWDLKLSRKAQRLNSLSAEVELAIRFEQAVEQRNSEMIAAFALAHLPAQRAEALVGRMEVRG